MKRRLRGITKLNECIQRFVGEWYLDSQIDTDFAYDPVSDTVFWTLVVSEQNDKDFHDFFYSLGCKVEADVFILSILHEIGHSQTLRYLSDEEYNYSQDRKAEKLSNYEYFNLPDEIEATKWAVNYLNENADKVEAFWNELQPLIMEFYKRNHIL